MTSSTPKASPTAEKPRKTTATSTLTSSTPKASPTAATREWKTVGGWNKPRNSFFNREISWLAFNARVLGLAADETIPLLERVRFLAIFSSNLDEFFQVRVAGLIERVEAGITKRSHDGLTAAEQLTEIRKIALKLCADQEQLFAQRIRPSLTTEGIHLTTVSQLEPEERNQLRSYFQHRVLPVLTPLAVDPGHPFPFISDLSLNLAVLMHDPIEKKNRFARVKVPSIFKRWVAVSEHNEDVGFYEKDVNIYETEPPSRFVAQEDVIATHLDLLFPGMEILEYHVFRVTRNADLIVDDEETADLLAAVEMELRRRQFRSAVRLELADTAPTEVAEWLLRELELQPESLYRVADTVGLSGLFEISTLPREDLKWPQWKGVTEPLLASETDKTKPANFFRILRKSNVLVHHPYSSFSKSVGEFIRQACTDPKVLAIKLTLYRTSDSPILDALIRAAEKGKQVAVLVELKARFDEEANIKWAKRLEQAGVHVAYGLIGLKIHTKIAMVVREEANGIRRYCHIGTGNYNPDTATIYEDLGLLTADPKIGEELASLFNQLTGYGHGISYQRLMVAPEQLRQRFLGLIENEINIANDSTSDIGPTSPLRTTVVTPHIIMKMNALVDPTMIEQLYEASQAGVRIDLIVRSQCCLQPGVPGLSENITVRSIVGRYLEHSRIYYFANANGPNKPALFIGSADLMPRNLDHRIEALVQIEDKNIEERIRRILDACLAHNRLAWTLTGEGVWVRYAGNNAHAKHSNVDLHDLMQQQATARSKGTDSTNSG